MNKCNHNGILIVRYSFSFTLLDIPQVVVIWPIRSQYMSPVQIKDLLSVLCSHFYFPHQPLNNVLMKTRTFFQACALSLSSLVISPFAFLCVVFRVILFFFFFSIVMAAQVTPLPHVLVLGHSFIPHLWQFIENHPREPYFLFHIRKPANISKVGMAWEVIRWSKRSNMIHDTNCTLWLFWFWVGPRLFKGLYWCQHLQWL